MSFSRRLHKELEEIRAANLPYFVEIKVDPTNLLVWQGLILPDEPPYNQGAFWIELTFPPEYPFKPPRLLFRTKIYHPNISEDGQVCLPILHADHWNPMIRSDQLIEAVVAMVNCPQTDNPLRPDIAEELRNHRKKFMMAAEQYTLKHAEPRP